MRIQHLRSGFVAICLVLLSAGLGAQPATPAVQATTIVLLRHAERQSLFDSDSPLSAAGLRRARALAPLLAAFQPAALYVSDLLRTQQTLAPTAAKLGLVPRVRPKGGSRALAAELLRELRGRTVLVCWHHELMAELARDLGVQGPVPAWSINTYDRLWIVRVSPSGSVTLEERRQGLDLSAPAALPAAAGR